MRHNKPKFLALSRMNIIVRILFYIFLLAGGLHSNSHYTQEISFESNFDLGWVYFQQSPMNIFVMKAHTVLGGKWHNANKSVVFKIAAISTNQPESHCVLNFLAVDVREVLLSEA